MTYFRKYSNYGRKRYNNSFQKRKKSASNLKKFAYQLGRVKSGLNSDTQVRDCYNRGLNMNKKIYEKKPLF